MLLGKEHKCPSSCATMISDHPAKPVNKHVQLLMKFNEEIFKRNVLTDIECIVGGQIFKTHRAVLICFSPYLKKKLLTTEGKPTKNRIQIPKVGPDEFEILLQYMYTGNLGVDCNTFLDVYKAASLLEIEDAKSECLQIIEGRDEIRTYFFAYVLCKKLGAQQNWHRAFKLITHRFEESVFSNEFMQLSLNFVMEILSAQTIGARSETIVFLAALNWLNNDYSRRGVHAAAVMKCVRFSSMTMEEIVACYHPPFLSHVVQTPDVMMMLFRATCYIAAKSEGQENWFKEYANPKRNLTLECLPMELWHKKMPAPVSAATDSQRQDSGRPIEKNNSSELWNIESAFSRLLRDPVEVTAGNLRKENEYMEQRTNFRSRYDYPIPEKDESADDLHSKMNYYLDRDVLLTAQPLNPNNAAVPPADEKFRNMRSLNNDAEIESNAKRYLEGVRFYRNPSSPKKKEKQNSFKRSEYNVGRGEPSISNRNTSTSSDEIQFVLPKETKIVHLSKGPQKYSVAEPKCEHKEYYAKENSNFKGGSNIIRIIPGGVRERVGAKVTASDTECSSRILNETSVERENVPLSQVTHSHTEVRNLEDGNVKRTVDPKNPRAVERKIEESDSYEESSLDNVASSKQDPKQHSYILVVCGMNPKNFKKEVGGEVLILDSKMNKWAPLKRTPEPRHNHSAACLYNALYVVGGCNPEETLNENRYVAKRSCFKLDLRDFKWRIMREMRYCRYDHGLVVYDGKLYAIGGQDENGRLSKHVEVYDPKRNRWRVLPSNMCCGRKAMGVATYADRIWIVGGLIESGKNGQLKAISHVDCYHPRERKWYFNLYSLPEPVCFCSLAVWQEKLFCLGGMVCINDEKTQATHDVLFVQSGNQRWEKGPRLPQPRIGGVAVVLRDDLYFLGGFDPDSDLNKQNVHFLTPNARSWVTGIPLPSHLFGIAAVSFSTN